MTTTTYPTRPMNHPLTDTDLADLAAFTRLVSLYWEERHDLELNPPDRPLGAPLNLPRYEPAREALEAKLGPERWERAEYLHELRAWANDPSH